MSMLDRIPIWAIYLFTVGLVLLVTEIGFRLGLWLQRRDPASLKGSVTAAVVTGLLGLLGFLLAFSIGIAVDHYDTRRQLVITDANAIEASYLEAGFLEEPERTTVRDLLLEYVDLRLAALDPAQLALEEAVGRSKEIHSELWLIVESQAGRNPDSGTARSFGDAVSEMIDAHNQRLAAILTLRLSPLLWLVLYATTVLTFFLLGLVSSADGSRNSIAIVLLALALAAALILIADLDRSQGGALTVSQQALRELERQFAVPAP
jgi:hypothetical protein